MVLEKKLISAGKIFGKKSSVEVTVGAVARRLKRERVEEEREREGLLMMSSHQRSLFSLTPQ